MDKAPDSDSGDCVFESRLGRISGRLHPARAGINISEHLAYPFRNASSTRQALTHLLLSQVASLQRALVKATKNDGKDVNQELGAGAARGLRWNLGRVASITEGGFNTKKHSVPPTQATELLAQVCNDKEAFEQAFDEAKAWLEREVQAMPKKAKVSALHAWKNEHSQACFAELRLCGPPPSAQGENSQCDGTKVIQGWMGARLRKGRLCCEGREAFGVLHMPTRILVFFTKRCDDGSSEVGVKWISFS